MSTTFTGMEPLGASALARVVTAASSICRLIVQHPRADTFVQNVGTQISCMEKMSSSVRADAME